MQIFMTMAVIKSSFSAKDLLVSGQIVGGSSLTKSDVGTVSLSSANTITGGVTISAGAIDIGNADAFGTSTLTINASGTVITGSAFNLQSAPELEFGGAGVYRTLAGPGPRGAPAARNFPKQ